MQFDELRVSLVSRLGHPVTRAVVAVFLLLVGALFFRELPSVFRWPMRILWLLSCGWLVFAFVRLLLQTRFTVKKMVFTLLMLGFQYLLVALACSAFIRLMSGRDDRLTTRGIQTLTPECREGIAALLAANRMNLFSRELGWELRPDYRSAQYTISPQGLRGTKVYAQSPADPAQRFLCIGDSFTFGTAVRDDESWPAKGEALLPGSEWLNFGVPATCLTQSYLRYLTMARKFGGKHVIIGFMSNDAMRTVNCFRPFVNVDSSAPFTKPFVRLRDGKLSIEPNPYSSLEDYHRLLADDRAELNRLRRLDYLSWSREKGSTNPIIRTLTYIADVRQLDQNFDAMFDDRMLLGRAIRDWLPQDPYGKAIYRPTSEAFIAITSLFDLYCKQVTDDGREPLIVLFPGPLDVEDHVHGFPCQYASLTAHLRAKGHVVLDFMEPLVAKHRGNLKTNALFVQSHYRSPINQEVAEAIIALIKQR